MKVHREVSGYSLFGGFLLFAHRKERNIYFIIVDLENREREREREKDGMGERGERGRQRETDRGKCENTGCVGLTYSQTPIAPALTTERKIERE